MRLERGEHAGSPRAVARARGSVRPRRSTSASPPTRSARSRAALSSVGELDVHGVALQFGLELVRRAAGDDLARGRRSPAARRAGRPPRGSRSQQDRIRSSRASRSISAHIGAAPRVQPLVGSSRNSTAGGGSGRAPRRGAGSSAGVGLGLAVGGRRDRRAPAARPPRARHAVQLGLQDQVLAAVASGSVACFWPTTPIARRTSTVAQRVDPRRDAPGVGPGERVRMRTVVACRPRWGRAGQTLSRPRRGGRCCRGPAPRRSAW